MQREKRERDQSQIETLFSLHTNSSHHLISSCEQPTSDSLKPFSLHRTSRPSKKGKEKNSFTSSPCSSRGGEVLIPKLLEGCCLKGFCESNERAVRRKETKTACRERESRERESERARGKRKCPRVTSPLHLLSHSNFDALQHLRLSLFICPVISSSCPVISSSVRFITLFSQDRARETCEGKVLVFPPFSSLFFLSRKFSSPKLPCMPLC